MTWLRRRWAASSEWWRARPFLSALVVMTLVFSAGFFRIQQLADHQEAASQQQSADNQARLDEEARIIASQRAELACIEKWVNDTTTRGLALTPLANQRLNDLFAAFEQAIVHHNKTAALRLTRKAIAENATYLMQAGKHPVPQPKLSCKLPTAPPTGKPSSKPAPTRTVTKTVHAPGATVTRPGPTVTRTVTAPPGKGHRR